MLICFVSNELAEFNQNGGIGTATSGLVAAMMEAGHHVEILYTGSVRGENGQSFRAEHLESGYNQLRSRGIQVFFVEDHFEERYTQDARRLSYAVFWFLRERRYDLIHFNDYGGNAFYTAVARRTGCAFSQTPVVITIHGPTLWAMELDQEPVAHIHQLELSFLEHTAIESCDCVIGVSQSLLDWLRERAVLLPPVTKLLKNLHPVLPELKGAGPLPAGALRELAFFGRMDERKGIACFTEAAAEFGRSHPDVIISFYGKFSRLRGEHAAGYVLSRLAALPNPIRFRTRFSREAALRALCRRGVLAVVPSKNENSPCVVVECQTLGIPFLASDVGGIPELIAPEDHKKVLFAPNSRSLAARFEDVAERGLDISKPYHDNVEIAASWLALFEQLSANQAAFDDGNDEPDPLISICITHYRRPQYLRPLLAALEAQTYPQLEVILVDDGSNDVAVDLELAALSKQRFRFPLHIHKITNGYLGAARNFAAKVAQGVFLKFQDDDNLPLPHEVETLVRAARQTDAEVVTCFSYWMRGSGPKSIFDQGDIHYFPLGNAPALGQLRNEFGDANALILRSTFENLSGFTEIRGVGQEDHEFFARCVSLGHKLVVVPEPLFHYRVQADSMLQTSSVYDGFARAGRGFSGIDRRYLQQLAQLPVGKRLKEEIDAVGWHRAGKNVHGWLHQQLLEHDPNDWRTIDRVIDLMGYYGRVEDALFLSVDHRSVHHSLEWMSTVGESRIAEREADLNGTRIPKVSRLGDVTDWELLGPALADVPGHWNREWPMVKSEYGGLLIHPVGSETTIVRLPNIVPPRSTRITIRWLHANPKGGAVRIAATTTFPAHFKSDSWFQLLPTDSSVDIEISTKPVDTPTDLILMTRAVGSDVDAWPVARLMMVEFELKAT